MAFDLSGSPETPAARALGRRRASSEAAVAGEVVVNAAVAAAEARARRIDPAGELLLYVVHGVLHLGGFRDHTAGEKRLMRAAEASDHISNTPRQLALYRALGWEPPEFAHLSTILGARPHAPFQAARGNFHESFREMGILPEALRNYLALLGWSPADGKTEILSPEELVEQFSLDHITKSPAVFDNDKLNWLNRHYMKECPPRRLAELAAPVLQAAGRLGAQPGPEVLAWIERCSMPC